MRLAQFVLFDGFDPLDIIAPYEILATAYEAELVSAEGPREVFSGAGLLSLKATAQLDPDRADLVVVPGAAGPLDEIPALLMQTLETPLPVLLGATLQKAILATVCGGSMIPAMAGLIAGRTATTHHLGLQQLSAMGVKTVEARVVDDGNLVSAAGVTSGLDLGIYLLEREFGAQVAHGVEQLIAYERRGTVWRD